MPSKNQTCFKSRCLIIPLIVFIVAIVGSIFTSMGMDWHDTLRLPDNVVSGRFISVAWTIIYILTTISVLLVFETKRDQRFKCLLKLFIANAILNVSWSLIFFVFHWMFFGLVVIILLELTVLLLTTMIWRRSKAASLLLVPYAVWLIVAGYFNYMIWSLN